MEEKLVYYGDWEVIEGRITLVRKVWDSYGDLCGGLCVRDGVRSFVNSCNTASILPGPNLGARLILLFHFLYRLKTTFLGLGFPILDFLLVYTIPVMCILTIPPPPPPPLVP